MLLSNVTAPQPSDPQKIGAVMEKVKKSWRIEQNCSEQVLRAKIFKKYPCRRQKEKNPHTIYSPNWTEIHKYTYYKYTNILNITKQARVNNMPWPSRNDIDSVEFKFRINFYWLLNYSPHKDICLKRHLKVSNWNFKIQHTFRIVRILPI